MTDITPLLTIYNKFAPKVVSTNNQNDRFGAEKYRNRYQCREFKSRSVSEAKHTSVQLQKQVKSGIRRDQKTPTQGAKNDRDVYD